SVVATVFAVLLLLSQWQHPPAVVWAGFALVMVAVPLLGVLVSTLALRRVVASPLGWVRRVRPQPGKGRGPGLAFIAAALVLLTVGLVITPGTFGGFGTAPLLIFTVVVVTGMGAVWLTGATARLTGRLLAERTGNPATLIAAERLRDDPWAAARTHAAVLLVTVVGAAFVGIRQALLAGLTGRDRWMYADNMPFYTTGINLTGAAILVALVITLAGLAVGTAESLAARRRGLSAQVAAGVPRPVLAKALLLETALPLAPAVALAGLGGIGIGIGYAVLAGAGVPVLPLLVPPAVYVACLLAAAASLPRLRRSVHPAELRYT
ncbi:ABC transporter permease, partial [Streptomyces avermitilis]